MKELFSFADEMGISICLYIENLLSYFRKKQDIYFKIDGTY